MLDKMAFGNYNQKITDRRTDFDWLCRDEKVVDAYSEDSLCGFTFTVNGFKTLFTLKTEQRKITHASQGLCLLLS